MVSSNEESLIYGIKLSSVGPGRVSGENIVHEPTNMDLAMKLHYLRGVYYFRSQAFEGLTITAIKEPMFTWFNHFYASCGRFRRSDSGRPYIKCNDCGARFIEAHCVKTLDEWLEMKDHQGSLHRLLVSQQVIGPDLQFSPLVLLQLTRFQCGGVSVGLSWAHVLGDAFSAADFINAWGQVMSGHYPARQPILAQSHSDTERSPIPIKKPEDLISATRVGPVGDHWISAGTHKMDSFSFHINPRTLSELQSKLSGPGGSNQTIPVFESLCGVVWKIVAQIRNGPVRGPGPNLVTICKNDPKGRGIGGAPSNDQVIRVLKADSPVTEADPKELAELMMNGAADERGRIEEAVERDQGLADFVIYGSNLTFVDLGEADFYGLEVKGEKPIHVNYTIDGVGDEGAVLVLPGPPEGDGGKIVTLIVPENELSALKSELKREFNF